MSIGGGKQVTTSGVDPATAAYNQRIHDAALQAAGNYSATGPSDATNQAAKTYGLFANGGASGLNALSGDADAVGKFMDPYLKNVVAGTNAQFGQDLSQLNTNADSAATQAGAFGGSRAAVVKGAAQGQLALGHEQQVAQLLSGGFSDAMSRAGQVANLGLAGAAGSQDVGAYLRELAQQQANPGVEQLKIMQGGVTAPNSTTSTEQKPGSNWLQTIGGIAGIGAGLFGGGPGGIIGGIKGIFK